MPHLSQRGHVVLNRSCFAANDPVPLEYPIDELAMMHRLALGEGVEVHALGLVDQDGRGYLFLGHSGAEKAPRRGFGWRNPASSC